jgi:integrase
MVEPQVVTADQIASEDVASALRTRCSRMANLAQPSPTSRETGDIIRPDDGRVHRLHSKRAGLSSATIELRCHTVRVFLDRLCAGDRALSTITVADVDSALARKVNEEHYARVTVQTCASSLRSFFRYAEMRGWCPAGIAASIMAPRMFQHESLPSGPAWETVQQILGDTVGDRPAAIRDHAILMPLAVYGVRAGDVARLLLSDIEWQRETIVSTRSKLLGSHSFPLCQSVGEAINPLPEGGETRFGLPGTVSDNACALSPSQVARSGRWSPGDFDHWGSQSNITDRIRCGTPARPA